jgi:Complex1_LYR-like
MAAVKTLRSILNELRLASPSGSIKDSLATQYILTQFRKYQTTDEFLCKEKDEMLFLGQTYHCYLQSLRVYKKINNDYKGDGERSVRDTANMVGFKLPHDPK